MRRLLLFVQLLIVAALLLSACGTDTVEVTRVVTQKETVVETVIQKETVIVEGTPETIEKEVEVTKIVEVMVTTEPEPMGEPDEIVLMTGAEIVTNHPLFALAEQYSKDNPHVNVVVDIAPWSEETWAKLGTGLATGSPPDLFRVSMGGLVGQGGLDTPLLIDVKEWMTEEEIAELGPDVTGPVTVDGRYVYWPTDVDWGASPVGNAKLFKEAGIDLEKLRQDGWTFDEFREIAKQLTQDTDGDGEPDVWGFAYASFHPASLFVELAHRAGAPDGSGNNGMQNWGNEWHIRGEPAEKAAQLLYDMVYVDGSVPREVTGLTDAMQLFYTGKAAIVPFWHGIVSSIEAYNKSVETGEIVGERADFEPLVLPYPYEQVGLNGNVARAVGLAVFRQEPYKGDEHTQNVIDFLRWLNSPVNLAAYANHEGFVPAKTSAYPYTTVTKNPEIQQWASWGKEHAWNCAFPIGHPAPDLWDRMGVHLTAMLNDEISPKEATDRITADADKIIADWAEENPELAEEWATPQEGWPECALSTVGGQ